MIDNYLDWVKGQRRSALHEMYYARKLSRLDPTPWGTGFYAGHAQAHSFEAHHWRRLQKDIEAMKSQGCSLSVEDDATGFLYRKLS